MEDVLALYEKPLSEAEPVVCIDEKPVVLHADLRPSRPMQPGQVLRRDCEYERRGTANAFCGVEPKAGRHYPRVTPDRSSPSSPIICWRSRNLSGRQHHSPGHGQSQFTPARLWWIGTARKAGSLGSVHRPLHTQARKLAESGGDRNQPVRPAVPGTATNPIAGRSAAGSQGLGSENES